VNLALEGTGTRISFLSSGLSADLISLSLSDKAREAIETTHLGTPVAKTYKPGETKSFGTLMVVIDHNPEGLVLVGLPPEQVTISYPDEAGADPLTFMAFATKQGAEEMKVDMRMVSKIELQIAELIIDDSHLGGGDPEPETAGPPYSWYLSSYTEAA
jgi:hypothetical protein